jgi:PAS domain S-box-containing protein
VPVFEKVRRSVDISKYLSFGGVTVIQRKIRLTTIGPLIISAILIVVFSIIFVISSRAGSANIQQGLDAVSIPVLTTTSKLLFNPLYNLDITTMNGILDPYVDGTTIVYAAVYDTNGAQIVEINKKWAPDIALSRDLSIQALSQTEIAKKEVGDYLILTRSIAVGTVQLGSVEIVFDQAPLRASLGKAQATISTTLVIALIAITSLFFVLFRYAVRPLNHLALVAQDISRGNLSAEIPVEGIEEISFLASALIALVGTVRNTIATLEERVTDRTKALSSVAEVSTAASTILETDKLLQEVVDLTKERFNFYHAHIYLLNEAGDTLVLASGAGEPGHQMVAQGRSIPLDREQSLVARAAREKKGVTVNDVTQTSDFLPNPLLPDTHSELAVPMIVGERVVGVFDVQSEIVGRFTDADIAVQTTLASQVASAVQNARLYTRAETVAQEAQSLVDNAPEAIIIVDLETGLFTNPNENAVRLYGLAREDLVKVGPAQMSPTRQPDGRDSTEKAMEKIGEAMQGGTPSFEWMHRNGQGEDFLCEIRLVRLPGEHPRVRASVTDITERKRNEELTRQRAQQQEALNLITQKIQSATTIESALQVTARELGRALGMKPTLVTLEPDSTNGERKSDS